MSASPTKQLQQKLTRAVAALRARRRDMAGELQTMERKFMRSFDIEGKDVILANAGKHHAMKQKMDLMKHTVSIADRIAQNQGDFCRPDFNGNEQLKNEYKELCAHQTIIGLKELDDLIAAKPLDVAVEQVEVQELADKDAPLYVKKFAEVKGSTQGMAERLQQLFPPPKAKPVTYVPKRSED